MTEREDKGLVEHLYGEQSPAEAQAFRRALEADPEAAAEAESLSELLATYRTIEDQAPPPRLDALILAHAREEAKKAPLPWWRKLLSSPLAGLAVAGSMAAVVAVISVSTSRAPSAIESAADWKQLQAKERTLAPTPVPTPVASVPPLPVLAPPTAGLEQAPDPAPRAEASNLALRQAGGEPQKEQQADRDADRDAPGGLLESAADKSERRRQSDHGKLSGRVAAPQGGPGAVRSVGAIGSVAEEKALAKNKKAELAEGGGAGFGGSVGGDNKPADDLRLARKDLADGELGRGARAAGEAELDSTGQADELKKGKAGAKADAPRELASRAPAPATPATAATVATPARAAPGPAAQAPAPTNLASPAPAGAPPAADPSPAPRTAEPHANAVATKTEPAAEPAKKPAQRASPVPEAPPSPPRVMTGPASGASKSTQGAEDVVDKSIALNARAVANAARTEALDRLARGDKEGARRVLIEAREKIPGTLPHAELTLRLARLEHEVFGRAAVAAQLAEEAATEFRALNANGQAEDALALAREVSTKSGGGGAAARPTVAAPARAKAAKQATEKADDSAKAAH